MDAQQAIALAVAAMAAGWLLWRLSISLRGLVWPDERTGCGKCGFAQQLRSGATTDEARRAAGVIPLHDRRSAVVRRQGPSDP